MTSRSKPQGSLVSTSLKFLVLWTLTSCLAIEKHNEETHGSNVNEIKSLFQLELHLPISNNTNKSLHGSDQMTAFDLNFLKHLPPLGKASPAENGFLGIFKDKDPSSKLSVPDDLYLLPKRIIEKSIKEAEREFISRTEAIQTIWRNSSGADRSSPVGIAFAFNTPNEEALSLSETSLLLELASTAFIKNINGSHSRVKRSPQFRDSRLIVNRPNPGKRRSQSFMGFRCDIPEGTNICRPTKYRTFNGWCNNKKIPSQGKSVSTLRRMLPPAYANGISEPRRDSVLGGPLPSPRVVSRNVHVDSSHLSNVHTLLLMQYAQFVDHDITLTPVHRGPEGKILNCRSCFSYKTVHPECYPIRVPTEDSYYPSNEEKYRTEGYCLPFTRSLPGQQNLGARQQINQNSAYLDSSQIYGENICKARMLWNPDGTLNGTNIANKGGPRKQLLPQIDFLNECRSPSGYCFFAGDGRASEQPGLAAIHTIFLRFHNSIAEDLRRLNSHWSNTKIYDESRRIVIAANQHIVYNELLPVLLGPNMVNAYDLTLQNDDYYSGYDESCDASIFNEFSTAAFRFGHSMVRPYFSLADGSYRNKRKNLQLRDGFFNSDMLYEGLMIDDIMRGMLIEPIETVDPFVTNELRNHLFENKKKQHSGLDLISLNINRGRDHGLQGYNAYREICSLKKAVTFDDLTNEIPVAAVSRLKSVYKHPDDIDLFTGSLVEKPVPGGILGPTMTCIIGTQFKFLKKCDRFWYETNDPVIRFSPIQLSEIRKTSLAKVVCDNLDNPPQVQRQALKAPHQFLNPRIPCDRLAGMNLQAWRESPNIHAPALKKSTDCQIGEYRVKVGKGALQSPCVSCICTVKGAKCASLRITSCTRLFREARVEDIQKDQVCTSQCGFLLSNKLQSSLFSNLIPKTSIRFPSSNRVGKRNSILY